MDDSGWIWQTFLNECARTQHPQRIGDIRIACAQADKDRALRLRPRAIERLLDERARTGKALILGLVAGLRSGGRRLYWPKESEPPSRDIPAPAHIEMTLRSLRAHPQWATGEPFHVRALVDWLHIHGTSVPWNAVYTALRNLARRKQPVVHARHEAHGRTLWVLLPTTPRPRARLASSVRAPELLAAQVERSGCPAVLLRDLLAPLRPWDRAELRRILHHRDPARMRACDDGGEVEYVYVGRLQGSPVLACATSLDAARAALSAKFATLTLRTIRRRLRLADLSGKTLYALSVRERLNTWIPELRTILRVAQTHAHGEWAMRLTAHVEYCAALSERVVSLRDEAPPSPRCLGLAQWSWRTTASTADMLQTFPGVPRSRQAFRPLLTRWHVLHRESALARNQHHHGDMVCWDTLDTYLGAYARLGTPPEKVVAQACLRVLGIGRPDLDDARWNEYIHSHERAGVDFFHRAVQRLSEDELR